MASRPRSRTTTRRPLTRDRVLRAAIKLADRKGIDSLSMRKLAQELGVEAMSLYNHVANKDEILDGIVDEVVAEIDLPAATDDWKAAIRAHVISWRDALVRHTWASNLSLSRQGGGPAQLRSSEWRLRTLREAGFAPDIVYHVFHVLEAYILGFMALHLSFPYEGEELKGLAEGFLRQIAVDEYPELVEHIRQHIEPDPARQGGFELGLDLILDSLERLRDTG